MARQAVVMITCDRCKREELQPASQHENKKEPVFLCVFKGQEIKYEDLCKRCEETINLNLENVKEWERNLNSLLGPKVQANEAPPVTAAPDYSPPKPHSNAASQKR